MLSSKKAHIIADLFDPSKGSEFQIPQIAISALILNFDGDIVVWTTRRFGNELHIKKWLELNEFSKRVEVHFVDMINSDSSGNHRNRFLFLLDLIRLYRAANSSIAPNEFVWKCGQANILFNLFSLFWLRCHVVGPIAGLELPRFSHMYGISRRFRLKYLIYYIALKIASYPFYIFYLLGRFKSIIVATNNDLNELPLSLKRVSIHHPEVDVSDLLKKIPDLQANFIFKNPEIKSILWCGSFIERKNPILAITVLLETLNSFPGSSVSMVGDGPLKTDILSMISLAKPEIRSRVNIFNNISRSDFLLKLASSDILLVTSMREANSVLVFEALAANITVVSTQISGMTDSVKQSGYLFDIKGKYVVADAVENLALAINSGFKSSPRKSLIIQYATQKAELSKLIKGILK